MVDILGARPPGPPHKWEVEGATATEGAITIRVMKSGVIHVKQELWSGTQMLLRTLQAVACVSMGGGRGEGTADGTTQANATPHPDATDIKHPSSPSADATTEGLFCCITVKLNKLGHQGSSTAEEYPPGTTEEEENSQKVPNKINPAPLGILPRMLRAKRSNSNSGGNKASFLNNLAFLKSGDSPNPGGVLDSLAFNTMGKETRRNSLSFLKCGDASSPTPGGVLDALGLLKDTSTPPLNENAAPSTPASSDPDLAGDSAASVVTDADDSEMASRSSTPASRNKRKLARPGKVIVCQLCGTTFAKERYLKDHIRRIHEIYECHLCGLANFYSSKGVEKHIAKVHGVTAPYRGAGDNKGNLNEAETMYNTPGSRDDDSSVEDEQVRMNDNGEGSVNSDPQLLQNTVVDTVQMPTLLPKFIPTLLPDFGLFGKNHILAATAAAAGVVASAPFLTSAAPQVALPPLVASSAGKKRRSRKARSAPTKAPETPPRQRKPKGTGTIPCPHCPTTFSELRYLKDHIKRRHMTFECPICGDTSSHSEVGVERHIQSMHDPNYVFKSEFLQHQKGSKPSLKSGEIPAISTPSPAKSATTSTKRPRGRARSTKGAKRSPLGVYDANDYLTGEDYTNSIDEHVNALNASYSERGRTEGRSSRKKRKISTPVKQPSVESTGDEGTLQDEMPPGGGVGEVDEMGAMHNETAEDVVHKDSDYDNTLSDGQATPVANRNSADSNGSSNHHYNGNNGSIFPVAVASDYVTSDNDDVSLVSKQPLSSGSLSNNKSKSSRRKSGGVGRRRKANPRGLGSIPCPYCNVKFAVMRYMREHIKRKHQTSIFQCQICGEKYTSSDGVQKHRRLMHGVEEGEDADTFFEEITDALGDRGSDTPTTQHSMESSPEEGESLPGTPNPLATDGGQVDSAKIENGPVFPVAAEEEQEEGENGIGSSLATTPLSVVTTSGVGNSSVFPTNVSPTGIVSVQNIEQQNDSFQNTEQPGLLGPDDTLDDFEDDALSLSGGQRKKKSRGAGTIPCPHCTKYFAMKRYLSDHLRRYHRTFECPYCEEGSFQGLKSINKHLEEAHKDKPGRKRVMLDGK